MSLCGLSKHPVDIRVHWPAVWWACWTEWQIWQSCSDNLPLFVFRFHGQLGKHALDGIRRRWPQQWGWLHQQCSTKTALYPDWHVVSAHLKVASFIPLMEEVYCESAYNYRPKGIAPHTNTHTCTQLISDAPAWYMHGTSVLDASCMTYPFTSHSVVGEQWR